MKKSGECPTIPVPAVEVSVQQDCSCIIRCLKSEAELAQYLNGHSSSYARLD